MSKCGIAVHHGCNVRQVCCCLCAPAGWVQHNQNFALDSVLCLGLRWNHTTAASVHTSGTREASIHADDAVRSIRQGMTSLCLSSFCIPFQHELMQVSLHEMVSLLCPLSPSLSLHHALCHQPHFCTGNSTTSVCAGKLITVVAT